MSGKKKIKKVHALYVRVSTEAQAEEGFSVGAQTQRLQAYCTAKGWDGGELYVDGGFSGSNLNRPQIQRLIRNAEAGRLSSVIVYKLDRLSRSQKDTLYLIEDVFMPNGVDFISLNESIDTSTPYGRAMIGILSAFAQLERENIFLRTRMGMLERVKQGYWMGGGSIPFGYDYDKERGILVPNGDASVVRRIFELYIAGFSAGHIAELLGLSSEALVTNILSRKTSLGIISYKGEEYAGRHEAIISRETYELAQRKMSERSSGRARATVSAAHLLSGLIYCGSCGARMRYISWGKRGYKLLCYSRDRSKKNMHTGKHCENEPVWAEEIENIVRGDLFRLSVQTENDGSCEYDALIDLEKQLERAEIRLKRLYNLYAENGDETLLETVEDNRARLDRLRTEYEQEKKNHSSRKELSALRERLSSVSSAWEHLTDLERQSLVRDCVERIIITGDNVDIYYKFARRGKAGSAA